MKESIRHTLERWPSLYLNTLRFKRRGHWSRDWVVSRDTHVCIEGYPRSANSFAHTAFRLSQDDPGSLRTATHTHSPAQIIQAVRWNIPTMVCIRDPTDAVRGILSFGLQLRAKNGEAFRLPSSKEVHQAIHRWAVFYGKIAKYRSEFYLAEFGRLTTDYSAVSAEFIERFNLPYRPYDAERLPPEKVFEKSFHIGPDVQRDRIKADVSTQLKTSPYVERLAECGEIYNLLTRDR